MYDNKIRVVTLDVLGAICGRISGMCHRYAVEKTTRSSVYVSYSNPDEWGSPHPVVAVYPAYRQGDSTYVVLDITRIMYGDEESWQAFECILETPKLWRDPKTGIWQTTLEARAEMAGVSKMGYLGVLLEVLIARNVDLTIDGFAMSALAQNWQCTEQPFADGDSSIVRFLRANADSILDQLEALASYGCNVVDEVVKKIEQIRQRAEPVA